MLILGPLLLTACGAESRSLPLCRGNNALILMAQSVPSATFAPCIAEFPAGWSFGGLDIRTGRAEFWLDSDRAGYRAVTVTLARSCDVSRAVPVPGGADEVGLRRFEEPEALPPRFSGNRYYVFPGGCVTYRFAFAPGTPFALAVEATDALSFVSRAEGVREIRGRGLELCGAGVPCPG